MSNLKKSWIIFILGTLSAFGPLSLDMYASALPDLQKDLSTTASLTQLSITTCLFGLAFGQIMFGPLTDRIGRKKPTLISLLVFTLSSLALALSPNIYFFVGFRLIQGLAGSVGIVTSKAMCSDIFKGKEFAHYFYLLMAVNSIFPVIAPTIGGFFLLFSDWRLIFITLAIIGLLLFFSVLGFKETLTQTNSHRDKLGSQFKQILKNPIFISFTLVSTLMTGALYAYIAGSSFMLQDLFKISAFSFSLLYAVNGIGQVVFTWLGSKLVQKFKQEKVLFGGIIIAILAAISLLITLLLPHRLDYVVLPLFLIVSIVGVGNPLGSALALEQERDLAGTASAIIGLTQNLLGGFISPLVGMAGTTTYAPMSWIILICEVSALIFWYIGNYPLTHKKDN
ncbi:multidrug effflux MFS transporter [Lactobacillus sp. PV034]|uniref:multidrug effflux MFS transporter n=1 Tax=Lactobacillus sp. PV034 TaxID=2594495 RepID=UPI00224024B5|nr:multidrug effflux MFS transporter [Lactobacillus sp. PV034]QNQ81241.1 multidrug effflux MFS transporter [Lactobacillus sp. PV034]